MKIDEPWVMIEIEEEPNERRNGLRDIRGRDDNLMNQITPNTMIATGEKLNFFSRLLLYYHYFKERIYFKKRNLSFSF